jgi:hypothetical protein
MQVKLCLKKFALELALQLTVYWQNKCYNIGYFISYVMNYVNGFPIDYANGYAICYAIENAIGYAISYVFTYAIDRTFWDFCKIMEKEEEED